MTALPVRPALADVLAALTCMADRRARPWLNGETRIWLERDGVHVHWTVPATPGTTPGPALWAAENAREGLERLQTLDLMLEDDVRRFFRCSCDGKRDGAPKGKGGQMVWNCPRCEDFADERPQFAVAHPPTIPALVSWASLGPAAILRAEELARETVMRLRQWGAPQTERVVWCVRPLTGREDDGSGTAWDDVLHDGDHTLESMGSTPAGVFIEQAHDVWEMGLVIASITADAITIVVPPVGAP